MIKKGSWVQIKKVILNPEQRPKTLPEATRKVPLTMWVKGYLNCEASLGDLVEITTVTGRKESGELVSINPYYNHSYGKFVPEILEIDRIVKRALFGSDKL